jgi:acylphosphatase
MLQRQRNSRDANKKKMDRKTLHLLIEGKVQGVFYRASAKEKADEMKITGWVKNTGDGNVEIVCQAGEAALQEFINWCKQGPTRAKVEHIKVTETTAAEFGDFRIVRE